MSRNAKQLSNQIRVFYSLFLTIMDEMTIYLAIIPCWIDTLIHTTTTIEIRDLKS